MTNVHHHPNSDPACCDRSDAVNLARSILEDGGTDITRIGVRILSYAVLRMDAAMARPGEPVGWIGTHPRTGQIEICAHTPSPSAIRDFKMQRVYTGIAPAATQPTIPAERVPLTDEQIDVLYQRQISNIQLLDVPSVRVRFARAIEAAHGIGGEE